MCLVCNSNSWASLLRPTVIEDKIEWPLRPFTRYLSPKIRAVLPARRFIRLQPQWSCHLAIYSITYYQGDRGAQKPISVYLFDREHFFSNVQVNLPFLCGIIPRGHLGCMYLGAMYFAMMLHFTSFGSFSYPIENAWRYAFSPPWSWCCLTIFIKTSCDTGWWIWRAIVTGTLR